MKPNPTFQKQPKTFWAYVRAISQKAGYTKRNTNQIKVPTLAEMRKALEFYKLDPDQIGTKHEPNELGQRLLDYFLYRANTLNNDVSPRLMNASQAQAEYERLAEKRTSPLVVTMNKQKGEKKKPAYLTAIVNMLIDEHRQGVSYNANPKKLTMITVNGRAVRTLARQVDGAFPDIINPLAIWEIKEYYYTTTFGSRVADGVYESLLDGMELEELQDNEKITVKHYVMVDAQFTWWVKGKAYLCRFVDMLHMGYADEILFGKEVIEELPRIVGEWVASYKAGETKP